VRTRAKTVIGLPAYNGAKHVVESLESLLAQTWSDFELVIVDDCSSDYTASLIEPYAAADPRIHFTRNASRLGLVANWRRAFQLATAANPELEYFAWASDHDAWHPRWLELVLAELEGHPEAVLAFPRVATVVQSGAVRFRDDAAFDTCDVDDPQERAELTWRAGGFGFRVYSLFRAEALARCGIYREVYLPDRLLLVELAAHGRFREIPEVLLYRRRMGRPSLQRQRASFFPDRLPPLSFRMPWPQAHSVILGWSLAVRGNARPSASRRQGLAIARRYRRLASEIGVPDA
jgi:glycosyltransferase involved in cell wall biosynthesis